MTSLLPRATATAMVRDPKFVLEMTSAYMRLALVTAAFRSTCRKAVPTIRDLRELVEGGLAMMRAGQNSNWTSAAWRSVGTTLMSFFGSENRYLTRGTRMMVHVKADIVIAERCGRVR